MTQSTDSEAARRLLDFLNKTPSTQRETDIMLDARIPEYVRAELAGKNAAALFPDVHAYILSDPAADALYHEFVEVEERLIHQPADVPLSYKPDLSFLEIDTSEDKAGLQAQIVDIAKKISASLQKKKLLIDAFARSFFELRPQYPDIYRLGEGAEHAFAALGADVPEEVRWLEAVYQTKLLTEGAPTSAIHQIARKAAENAGLPRALRDKFADQYMKVAAETKPTSR